MSCIIDITGRLAETRAAAQQSAEKCAWMAHSADDDYFGAHWHRAHTVRDASPGEVVLSGLPRAETIKHHVVVRSAHGVRAGIIIGAYSSDCRLEPARRGEGVSARIWQRAFNHAPRAWCQMFRDAERFTRRNRPEHYENRHTGFIFPEDGEFALEFYGDSGGWHEAAGPLGQILAHADLIVRNDRSSAYCADVRVTLPLAIVNLTRSVRPAATSLTLARR
ncbi:hypothetical protein [Castellaniella sp.]|uniref:hypothetical protein n=1 Tax=Castellaniella sp. TaxID=1955812 RepID=UPI002AFF820E|nr:hypothetical protein [Castellaniella sp.]